MTIFSKKDKQQLTSKGISVEKVLNQIETFKEGIPFIVLNKAAVINDGILKFTPDEEKDLIQNFKDSKDFISLLKFVPASGAASRMFKAAFNFLEKYNPKSEKLEDYFSRTTDKDIKTFYNGLKDLPFYEIVQKRIEGKSTSTGEELYFFIEDMLNEKGLNFGFYPKGLLPFHNYGNFVATSFEEHLKEASFYASTKSVARLHFTISEQHADMFDDEFDKIKKRVSDATKTSFNVSYSFQKSETDTIAVLMNDQLFRNTDSSLLFRPGGHGALIENLNEQQADIIFIKNIDNVVTSDLVEEVANSKMILAGLLLKVQKKAFSYAALLEDTASLNQEQIIEIKRFLMHDLNVRVSDDFNSYNSAKQIAMLKDKIDRPLRICGMVKNEGQPGGGPFWINDKNDTTSLQIIEAAQVDTSNPQQIEIFNNSTHFNPVDLVCGIKNYKGEKYNLLNFVDVKQGFITEKTKDGKDLKALELPGLWNGAMAYWNTIFVEVPIITFNPVKTVNDLLKPAHQV